MGELIHLIWHNKAGSPVDLEVPGVGGVSEVLHVGADEHLAQLGEVAVVLVLHLHHAPRVLAGAHHLVADLKYEMNGSE